jgi:dethiobiotin synthetase
VSSPKAEPQRASGLFVSASGTGSGKTMVTCSIVHALATRARRVAGVKPFETGCTPYPLDALALASASGDASLADRPAWYRAEPALAPYAVELATGFAPPDLPAIAAEVRRLELAYHHVIVEGAGGVLVPVDRERTMIDVMELLGYPLVLVAEDRLGVLSYVLTAYACVIARGLRVAAIVLNQVDERTPADTSVGTNRRILEGRVACPVISFPFVRTQQPAALAEAADASGLMRALTEHLDSSANR